MASGYWVIFTRSAPITANILLSARVEKRGPFTTTVVPPSCMAIIAGPQPFSSLRIPVYQPTLESSAAAASGIRRALDAQGKRDTQVVVFAGDGGTYDIGFQCLSSAAERNEDFIYVCLDNEGYMNTGAQKSSSTPRYAKTGSTPAGKTSRKKNLTEIMAAHGVPYAATATAGFLPDLVRKVEEQTAVNEARMQMALESVDHQRLDIEEEAEKIRAQELVKQFKMDMGLVETPAEPVAEMNISGNHLELWKRLVAVGNDPFAYSNLRTPTLVFEGVQVAGT